MPLRTTGPAQAIRVSGPPREQGRQHGRLARDLIVENLALIRQGMAALSARGRQYDYDGVLRANQAFVSEAAPEILDEVEGIAESAEVPYQDLLLLNLPLYFIGVLLPLECSQILVAPPATANHTTLLAKTRDLGRGRLRHVVLHRCYPDGLELIEVSVAGSITWPGSGLSSRGVALTTSGVWSKRTAIHLDRAAGGWLLVNSHLLLRDSHSLDDLARRAAEQPRVTGLNILAADRHRAAALELTSDRLYRADAEDGVAVRTNHYLEPEIQHLGPTREEYPGTYHRYEVAKGAVRQAYGSWDVARLTALLASHDGYPQQSLCRHAQNGEGADTVYGSVASLPDGSFWAVLDNPCQARLSA